MRLTLENHFETVKSDIRPSRPMEFNAGTLAAAGKTRKWRLREAAYDGGHPVSIWNGVRSWRIIVLTLRLRQQGFGKLN